MSKTLEVGKVYQTIDSSSRLVVAKTECKTHPFVSVLSTNLHDPMVHAIDGKTDWVSARGYDLIIPQPKKLIDLSKMPIGTMTNYGEIIDTNNLPLTRQMGILNERLSVYWQYPRDIRLAEQTEFTYWGGGDCPVPEGVMVEVVLRDQRKIITTSGSLYWEHSNEDRRREHIIAYRIIGLADGYTDNPAEVVE
jgi:hypothetical protein